jgi:sugar-specific transcriptional regulator TrmB
MDTAERLLRGLGFTSYESRIVIALTRRHPANGYEVGKLSGVPTSKVYAALEALRNGGFIVADETRSPVRYDPVPISEIASRLRSAHDGAVESLEGALRRIAPLPEPELSWNIPDYGSVLERIRRLLREAGSGAMLSLWPRELEALRPEIELALGRGLRIVVACFGRGRGMRRRAVGDAGRGRHGRPMDLVGGGAARRRGVRAPRHVGAFPARRARRGSPRPAALEESADAVPIGVQMRRMR